MTPNDENKPDVTQNAPESQPQPASASVAPDSQAAPIAAEVQAAEQAELQTLRTELEQMTDLARRSQADLENYRKRVARELEQERRYAHLPILVDLLPVIDNLERAMAAAGGSPNETGGLLQGVSMVLEQFRGVLGRWGCQRIEAVGQPFDPNRHQAISQMPSADHPPGTVILEALPGYMLHERVVRPSQVIVSAAPPEAPG